MWCKKSSLDHFFNKKDTTNKGGSLGFQSQE